MSGDDVRISARTLMEVLAGHISLDVFLDRHGRGQRLVLLLEQKLRQGRLLTNAVVEPVPGQDDDWITFRFGAPDPAVGSLKPE